MDSAAIKKVNREVFQRHPQMSGINPKVSQQTADRYLLVYSKTIEIAQEVETCKKPSGDRGSTGNVRKCQLLKLAGAYESNDELN